MYQNTRVYCSALDHALVTGFLRIKIRINVLDSCNTIDLPRVPLPSLLRFRSRSLVSPDMRPSPYLSSSSKASLPSRLSHSLPHPRLFFLFFLLLSSILSSLPASASITSASLPTVQLPSTDRHPCLSSGLPIRNASTCSSPAAVCTSLW